MRAMPRQGRKYAIGDYVRLEEYSNVRHDHRIDVVRRGDDGSWSRESAGAGGTLWLTSIDGELAVDDVYRDPLA